MLRTKRKIVVKLCLFDEIWGDRNVDVQKWCLSGMTCQTVQGKGGERLDARQAPGRLWTREGLSLLLPLYIKYYK